MVVCLYLISTNGLALNLHFCGKKLAKVQFQHQKVRSCCSQNAEKESGCCSNQLVQTRVSNEHLGASVIHWEGTPALTLPTHFLKQQKLKSNKQETGFIVVKPPPPGIPIGLRICVFRI